MAKKITQNVNKDKLFNDLPEVHPDMNTWGTRVTNYQSCNLGQIVPIYYEEVLPNQKKNRINLAMISHMVTPIAPFFNAGYTEIRSFFCPMRLAADLLNGYSTRKSPWVKVFGEDNKSTSADIIVPLSSQKLPDVSSSFSSSISTYKAGVSSDDNVLDSLDLTGNSFGNTKYNYLNLAVYELIYQRHYRNENYELSTESPLYKVLYNAYNSVNVPALPTTFLFERANREKDYFTGSKPFTQKGDAVQVGLVGSAPVVSASTAHSMGNAVQFGSNENLTAGTHNLLSRHSGEYGSKDGTLQMDTNDTSDIVGITLNVTRSNLIADLSSAQGISIEELRILIKTQELLEKDALYGSLYAESLNAHFGTCPLDLTLQDPQELYRTTITSNMQAIFQTSSTSGEQSILGTIGANSTTQTDPFMIVPETTFREHGILMICAVHKLQNVYDAKYFKPKFLFKKARFDFYTPELNDLGYQSVTSEETGFGSGSVGFNEAFAEYRYKFNKVHGELASQFPYWAPAIGNEYASIAAMYKEDTGILDKALSVTSSTAPQFYDAWGFEEVDTKPMSLHSIPGMDGVI